MAATPPHQITFAPDTPSTPRHGPMYDNGTPTTRSSARLRQKRALDTANSGAHDQSRAIDPAKSPKSPPARSQNTKTSSHSPSSTPKRRVVHRVQIHSPTSPNTKPTNAHSANLDSSRLRPYNSSTAIMGDGMLPTPIKTPKKKQMPKSNVAGRVLFQDTVGLGEVAQSPRKARKNRRFNGFSLESFRADDDAGEGQIQIFTDSRDQVPETDHRGENPFVQASKQAVRSERIPGTAKRRKVSEPRGRDPQVEEAIRNDEGMVYVFRGKKVFRRFDDNGEEEEEIDPSDLGLLEHSISGTDARRRFKTLTRKSIKPTRLFQAEEQKRTREAEKDEEATTDIDDTAPVTKNNASFKPTSSMTSAEEVSTPIVETDHHEDGTRRKKGSPFDSWPRSKSSASSSASKQPRGQKRALVEEGQGLTVGSET